MEIVYLFRQHYILSRTSRWGSLQPCVVPAGTPYGALVETSSNRHIMATGYSAWLAFTNSKARRGASWSPARTRPRLLPGSRVPAAVAYSRAAGA